MDVTADVSSTGKRLYIAQSSRICIGTTLVRKTLAEWEITWQAEKAISNVVYGMSLKKPLQQPQLAAAFAKCMRRITWTIVPTTIRSGDFETQTRVVKNHFFLNTHQQFLQRISKKTIKNFSNSTVKKIQRKHSRNIEQQSKDRRMHVDLLPSSICGYHSCL